MVGVGDKIPEGTKFSYVPYDEATADEVTACGIPQSFDPAKRFAGKKVVIFAVPGAFTPGCSERHLPGFKAKLGELRARGADLVVCLASNDPFVMSAWSKANGIRNEDILFVTDDDLNFSVTLGTDGSKDGDGWTMGGRRTRRAARYALILDDNRIVYAEREPARDITVSGADAVLAKL